MRPMCRVFLRLTLLGSLLLLILLCAVTAGAAEVEYSTIDKATVRVFAIDGMDLVEIEGKHPRSRKDTVYKLAVPSGGHGSGLRVTPGGIILTAAHVVDEARLVAVKDPATGMAHPAQVIFKSDAHDVAFLLVPGKSGAFVPLTPHAPPLRVRQTVYAVGYPLDAAHRRPQSTRGVIAGVLEDGRLQLGISVNPGNSGGPVISDQDELLGIVSLGADTRKGAQGLAVAIAADRIAQLFAQHVIGSKRLSEAQTALSAVNAGDYAAAELVASMIEQRGVVDNVIGDIEGFDAGAFRKRELVSQRATLASPDLLMLLAGFHWNSGVVRFALGELDSADGRARATELARQALKLDPAIPDRSPFVWTAVGKMEGERARKARAKHRRARGPVGLAGLKFGVGRADAQRACEKEGHRFTKIPGGYRCSGAVDDVPFEAEVNLVFCEERLCRIDVLMEPSKSLSAPWMSRYKKLYRNLTGRWGDAPENKRRIPAHCVRAILPCLQKGQAFVRHKWSWPDNKAELAMGRLAGKPMIVLSVRRDPAAVAAAK